jgi:hypothetical protein
LLSVLKKKRKRQIGANKKEKKKPHQQKKNKERKGSKEKNSEVLASFCGLVVSCFVVCLN